MVKKKKEDWKKLLKKAKGCIKLPHIKPQSGKADEVEMEYYEKWNGEKIVIFSMPKK